MIMLYSLFSDYQSSEMRMKERQEGRIYILIDTSDQLLLGSG
jgi:hypothetical protein